METRHSLLAKDGLQVSSNAVKFVSQKLVESMLVPTLRQLVRSPQNSRKLLGTMTFHQTKTAWEEVTVPCMKGVWHKIWPSNENFGTNCDNLDMLIK